MLEVMRRRRRVPKAGAALALCLAVLACGHDELPQPQTPRVLSGEAVTETSTTPLALRMYVLGDPQSWRGGRGLSFVPLGGPNDGVGAIQDGLRIVASTSGLRAASETTDPPITAGERMPAHLGGGFLFQTQTSLYTSPTFDGPLHPLATVPGEVGSISFGPQGILVRGSDGQRWYVDAKTGGAAVMSPPGLVDVASLPDGRAAALTEFGFALVSSDGGQHWQDVTHQLAASPTAVLVVQDELWIETSAQRGEAVRVDPGGTLVAFDKSPTLDPPLLRPRDTRWNDRYEPPIRHAIRLGVPLDDHTALVVDDGNIDTVDVTTGELVDVATGKVPPDASCEALRTHDDILLVCTQQSGPSFVASHVLGERPVVEQTFGAEGIFYAGDDGALAFAGPCTSSTASSKIVCVRSPGGSWQELDLEAASDVGAQADVLRWVPRPDGSVVAIASAPKLGVIDGRTGEFKQWDDSVGEYASSLRGSYSNGRDSHPIDRAWTATSAGGLRGWVDGAAIEVTPDGAVQLSPFKFDRGGRVAESGPYALAVHEGRFFQTTDRGVTWTEVATPLVAPQKNPNARTNLMPHVCSAVGCDLNEWYRIGWSPTAPVPPREPKIAGAAPHLPQAPTPSITCRVDGAASTTSVPRSDESPDDLGLGTMRVPPSPSSEVEQVHTPFLRLVLNPPHSVDITADPSSDAPRALLYGYATSNDDGDRITVLGPNKDPMALRRMVAFVPPFDVAQAVRKTSFGLAELVQSARGIGMSALDVLADDPSMVTSFVPVLGDAQQPADLVVGSPSGMIGILRANNAKPRVAMRVKRGDDSYLTSAASLGPDEIAVLELDADGTGHVMKWTPGGVADLFDVPASPSTDLYPANPDAIAVGPRGDIAVLRTSSGGTPPSEQDPALLFGSNGQPTPLAPWSTLTLANDPACKALAALPSADPNGGWRAIVQTSRSWISFAGPGMQAADDAPALVRVRWTPSRVCLEAAEVRLQPGRIRTTQKSGDGSAASPVDLDVQTWLVARWTGTPAATKASVMLGSEQRQPIDCATK